MSKQLPLGLRLKQSARFSNFVAGPNEELLEQLQQSARGCGEPFVLCWGSTGCGKTHLLQACCHLAGDTDRTVAYLSFREASQLKPQLLEGWEYFDLVCLDDVDLIAAAPLWEEALFHLYNRIREQAGTLLMSSAQAPSQLPIRLEDLRSRLNAAVVYPLKALNDDQRLQVLQLRASQRGCQIPEETGRYLLRRMPRELPALLELLDHLDEASLVAQRKLTVPFVKSVLGL